MKNPRVDPRTVVFDGEAFGYLATSGEGIDPIAGLSDQVVGLTPTRGLARASAPSRRPCARRRASGWCAPARRPCSSIRAATSSCPRSTARACVWSVPADAPDQLVWFAPDGTLGAGRACRGAARRSPRSRSRATRPGSSPCSPTAAAPTSWPPRSNAATTAGRSALGPVALRPRRRRRARRSTSPGSTRARVASITGLADGATRVVDAGARRLRARARQGPAGGVIGRRRQRRPARAHGGRLPRRAERRRLAGACGRHPLRGGAAARLIDPSSPSAAARGRLDGRRARVRVRRGGGARASARWAHPTRSAADAHARLLDAIALLLPVPCAGCGAPDRVGLRRVPSPPSRRRPGASSAATSSRLGGARVRGRRGQRDRRLQGRRRDGCRGAPRPGAGRRDRRRPRRALRLAAGTVEVCTVPSTPAAMRPARLRARRRAARRAAASARRPCCASRGRDATRRGSASRRAGPTRRGRSRPAHASLGRRFLLVDDVLTTGATLAETRRAVTAAGGSVVAVAVLAETPLRRSGHPSASRETLRDIGTHGRLRWQDRRGRSTLQIRVTRR